MQGMTQAEYARHRGVKPPHINRLVKAGKIPVGEDGKINPADADFALDGGKARLNEPRDPAPASAVSADSGGLTRARTATEVYKARLAQLAYEERLGKALPLDGVVEATVSFGEVLTRIIGGLSRRADDVAAAQARAGVAGVRQCLKGIEFDMRKQMAEALAKLGASATSVRAASEPAEVFEESEAA